MSKILKSKLKPGRRYGLILLGNDKATRNKKNYQPGQHGPDKVKSTSAYGKRANAARALRHYYGIRNEKQFKNYFINARNAKGNTVDNFIKAIETRLDMVAYRLKLASTIFAARQLVTHGHLCLNGIPVNKPCISVKENDTITITQKSKDLAIIKETMANKSNTVPGYLSFDENELTGKLLKYPTLNEVPYPFAVPINPIIEYYSK